MTRRTLLIGLTVAALTTLPAAAIGGQDASLHPTQIRWMAFDHIHPANTTMIITGQVSAHYGGNAGALAGVPVQVYRQLDGNPGWVLLGSTKTGTGAKPVFRFPTLARQNATYRVSYAGNDTFGASRRGTWLSVFRSFNGTIKDGTDAATLSGHVTPFYTHKSIVLQRRPCASCGYTDYKNATTGAGGTYSFALPAPPSGHWWWRVRIPGTAAFIASYGGTFSTTLS
jgi:hypothetical protein